MKLESTFKWKDGEEKIIHSPILCVLIWIICIVFLIVTLPFHIILWFLGLQGFIKKESATKTKYSAHRNMFKPRKR